ncbi:MAG: tRNA pseudouridine(38-40) synthase TruA [Bacteroidia bacterium]|nr:tRNA pseudouridine(38-40) synthase TruA [Bacteroidia bacterium]MCO5254875.1 tRNA pseudouridine(38-40) synthase TruA [Bacteroidota bacterium]MCZ2128952.1 tRNA pseudouridine(38-40) synthase TruA [Bacteroidia bacterium]
MRYFLEIAFDGQPFCGWQLQANGNTVQAEVDKALSIIFRKETFCLGCGRTDSGVHARQFFLHFDTDESIADKAMFLRKFNGITPHQIAAIAVRQVKDGINARFAAISRTYEYRISLKKNPFEVGKAYFIWHQPDIKRMKEAAKLLIGKKDFKAFSRVNDLKNHICDLTEAHLEEDGDMIVFTITANRFLRNMVRAIMGTLLDIGYGKMEPENLLSILASKDRKKAGQSVPPDGLYLYKIQYPDEIFID